MTLNDFLEYVKTRKALDTEEIHRFMDEMSNEARRVTFKLNTSYYAPDEVRAVALRTFRKTRAALASRVPAVLYGFRKEY